MKRLIIFTGFLGLLFIAPHQAKALGLSVSPSRLNFEEPSAQYLVVTNSSKDSVLYVVYPDEFESLIKVQPSEFELAKGEVQKIAVEVSEVFGRTIATNISVVGKPKANSDITFQTGIKIPLVASFGTNNNLTASIYNAITDLRWYLIALGIILGASMLWKIFRSKKLYL